jgi:non-ribosomal peptide synthase protein (TIGR01720 family)
MSYKSWAARLVSHAASPTIAAEAAYWLAAVPTVVRPLPRDSEGTHLVGDTREVAVALDSEETTALLQLVPAALRTQINEVLLTALVQALAPWSGDAALLVDIEGRGHEDLFADTDISRSVGWFTTMYPLWLDLRSSNGAEAGLRVVKESMRAVPGRGIGYGLLRQLGTAPAIAQRLASQPAAEVAFNYLGQFAQQSMGEVPFRWSRRAPGPTRHSEDLRVHLIDIDGWVLDGQLTFCWTYSERIHRQSTVAGLAAAFTNRLRAMIAISRTAGSAALAPSDFPMAGLDQGKLNKLLAMVSKKNPQ